MQHVGIWLRLARDATQNVVDVVVKTNRIPFWLDWVHHPF